MKATALFAVLLVSGASEGQKIGLIAPPGVPVRLVDAASGAPIANHKVNVYADDGVRCVRAPCGGLSSSWNGTSDAKGLITPPSHSGNVTTAGYGQGRTLENDAAVAADGQLSLELDPDEKTNADLRRYKLLDAATGAPLANTPVMIDFAGACPATRGTTNALGNVYYAARCATGKGTVTAAGYAPAPTPSPGWVNYRVELLQEGLTAVGPGQLSIVSGTYGGNCGVARGNKTLALTAACGGKRTCAYRVDAAVLGDPAYGCGKNYVAEWRCGGQGPLYTATAEAEAGRGSVLTLDCVSPPPPVLPLPPPPPPAATQGIAVIDGMAGSDCEPGGDYTQALARACDGKQRCAFPLGKAPAPKKCLKDFVAKWRCGTGDRTSLRLAAPGSKSVTLSCEAPAPAPAPPAKGVQIHAATYGGNCGAPRGNASAAVAAACNGKDSCPWVVDWKELGDPAHGCGKDFVVEWRCGGSAKTGSVTLPPEAGVKKTALISCQ